MSPEVRRQQRFLALDPARSVTVEACAGSGKTWLLSSRLLRLLLAGVRPGEILAITYTRKAAREIEARLQSLLRELALGDADTALRMLTERGLSRAEAQARLPLARGLFEQVMRADPPITVTTFHGWFARLLGGAPLDSGLAGRSLDEAAASLLDEAWAELARDCAAAPDGPLAGSLLWLYDALGLASTRKLLRAFVERRAEWQVWSEARGGSAGIDAWQDMVFRMDAMPLAELASSERLDELELFARLLGQNTAGDQALGNDLAALVVALRTQASGAPVTESGFEILRRVFLTASDSPRARKSSAAQAKRLGEGGERSFLDLHEAWSERVQEVLGHRQDRAAGELNRHALRIGEALLERLGALKRQRQAMDFGDLEAEVDRLLAREGSAEWLQARLDARYRHILLDEFQDTNPLQWRILRGWLDAYEGSGLGPPGVFLVGDPKQSIYRFRRAEPRLFSAAAEHFERLFGALRIGNAHTFRNAGGIVSLVNRVFDGIPGFVPQTAEREDWPFRIEVLPLMGAQATEQTERQGRRNPLEAPRIEADDLRRASEAAELARRIRALAGRWQVMGRDGRARPARYSDVLILTRRKTYLGTYEAALRAEGIPYVSPGQGGLLGTMEVQDVLAVLRFLAMPSDDLALAHALRSPAFGFSNAELLALSEAGGSWWPALRRRAGEAAPERIRQAAGLLEDWLAAAAHLPAHDLIDRIFHQSDWFARYRAAVEAERWPGIRANLEALLELALSVDAGRYPSLTRFVDELRRLSGVDDESPDEGLVASAGDGLGRVRIMTIHGAKGLEAPVVWLIDANAPPRPADGYTVALDWPAEASAPSHFSLLGRTSEAGPSRVPLLESERLAAEREELNLLYVAITRAEQVLFVSGSETTRKLEGTAYQRILAAGRAMGGEGDEGGVVIGGLPELDRAQHEAPAVVARGDAPPAAVALGRRRPLQQPAADDNPAGMAFGTEMHAWLEAHASGWPLPKISPEAERAARRIAARPSLRRFFDPACYRRAANETAYIGVDGRLGRIDRWVDTGDAVWVLDYKSGKPPAAGLLEEYREQIRRYREVLAGIFPGRRIEGMLIFSDGGELCVDREDPTL